MKLLDLLMAIVLVAMLTSMLGPRLAAAKRRIHDTWVNVQVSHHERIDYLASGVLEDPKAHHSTEKDAQDSLEYFTKLRFEGR